MKPPIFWATRTPILSSAPSMNGRALRPDTGAPCIRFPHNSCRRNHIGFLSNVDWGNNRLTQRCVPRALTPPVLRLALNQGSRGTGGLGFRGDALERLPVGPKLVANGRSRDHLYWN